jgi:hypothetical protein
MWSDRCEAAERGFWQYGFRRPHRGGHRAGQRAGQAHGAEARDGGHLVDATAGRRTRAVLMMDTGHVILSAVQPETIAGRLQSES